MSRAEQIKLAILMLLLPIVGWMGRGAYDSVHRTRESRALFQQADEASHNGKIDEAVALLEQAVQDDPKFFEAWQLLAQCEYDQKDRSRTIAVYQRAILCLPNEGRLEQRIADMYALDGQLDRSLEHLARARDLLGPDPDVIHAMERVQRWKTTGRG